MNGDTYIEKDPAAQRDRVAQLTLGDVAAVWRRNATTLGYPSFQAFALQACREKFQSTGLPLSPLVASFEALLGAVRAGEDGAVDRLEAQLRDLGLVGPAPIG